MDEYDVIYLDEDERNAVNDHRKGGSRVTVGTRRPGGSSVVVPPSRRPTVIHTGSSSSAAGRVVARRPVVVQEGGSFRGGLAGLSTGEIVELAAQILAAIQPLPGAPTATRDLETDVENLVTYQGALATHAKRDEQLRTLGSLLGRILR